MMLKPGMRVVLKTADVPGSWAGVEGHYGKVTEVRADLIYVNITGRAPGLKPRVELANDLNPFFADELEVVD